MVITGCVSKSSVQNIAWNFIVLVDKAYNSQSSLKVSSALSTSTIKFQAIFWTLLLETNQADNSSTATA